MRVSRYAHLAYGAARRAPRQRVRVLARWDRHDVPTALPRRHHSTEHCLTRRQDYVASAHSQCGEWGCLRFCPKLLFAPAKQRNKRCAVKVMAWGEVLFLGDFCEARERANELTVIAAIHAIAHGATVLHGNRAVQLNGEIRDALARIDDLIVNDGPCGTSGAASATAAAMLLRKRSIDRQW